MRAPVGYRLGSGRNWQIVGLLLRIIRDSLTGGAVAEADYASGFSSPLSGGTEFLSSCCALYRSSSAW